MKKLIIIIVSSILTITNLNAQTLSYNTKILQSQCTVHSKESNTVATVAGAVGGAVIGGYIGKKLFKSKYLATATGAGAGAIIGNEIGSKKTYLCTIVFKNFNNINIEQKTLGKEYRVNDIISVQESNNLFIIN